MQDPEKIIKELESLRDICNARSDIFVGDAKIIWAGYGRTVSDAIALIEDQKRIYLALEHDWKMLRNMETQRDSVDAFIKWCSESHMMGDATLKGIKYWVGKYKEQL